MRKLLAGGVPLALWIIAANLTFLSVSSLVGVANAQGQGEFAQVIACGRYGSNNSNVCWIRAEALRAEREFSR